MTDLPRWVLMWLLAVAIFAACKALTWATAGVRGVPAWGHLGYLAGWPGLDAPAFLASCRKSSQARRVSEGHIQPSLTRRACEEPLRTTRNDFHRPSGNEWVFAAFKTALGAATVFGGVRLVPEEMPYLAGWVGMVGLVFALHFGGFHLLSCFWRSLGVEAKPLMHWPLAATSLADFWGRRWNTAFRDLTHRFLFRPLAPRFGPRGAVAAGFTFSGVVHDAVISLPAGGGYGGPTLYFLLHGAGLLAERRWKWVRGRVFTLLMLLLPAPLLFHPPFVWNVVNPFLAALGATG